MMLRMLRIPYEPGGEINGHMHRANVQAMSSFNFQRISVCLSDCMCVAVITRVNEENDIYK